MTRTWALPLIGMLIGALVGFGALSWFGRTDDAAAPTGLPREQNDTAVITDFLEAWERFRLGTFVLTSEFTRTLDDGSVLRTPRSLVQAPPVRVTSEFTRDSPSFVGPDVACVSDDLGFFSCTDPNADMATYREELQAEQLVLASYFTGEPPLYVLERIDAQCFELLLAQADPLPPYGSRAEFCFDGDSGALARQLIVKEGAVDEVIAVEIRNSVTAADLTLDDAG